MAEEKGRVHDGLLNHAKQHYKHGAERLKNFRFTGHPSVNEAGTKDVTEEEVGPPPVEVRLPHSRSEVDRSNIEDFPYNEAREDAFTTELLTVIDADEELTSPKSQGSVHSLSTAHSSVSGSSWASNQKTVSGLGMKEGHPREVLGPYKRFFAEEILEAVPTEYQDYVKNKDGTPNDGSSTGNSSIGRSSSASSDRDVPDSLYADLASISDDELRRPEEGNARVGDGASTDERIASANQTSKILLHMKIQESNQ